MTQPATCKVIATTYLLRGQLLSKSRVEAMVSTPFSVAPAAWRSHGKCRSPLTRASALYPSTPFISKPSALMAAALTPCACRVVCRTMGNASLDALFIGQVRARVVGHPDHQGKRAIAGRGGPVCPRHLGALGCPDGLKINVFCEKPRRCATPRPLSRSWQTILNVLWYSFCLQVLVAGSLGSHARVPRLLPVSVCVPVPPAGRVLVYWQCLPGWGGTGHVAQIRCPPHDGALGLSSFGVQGRVSRVSGIA